MGGLNSKQISDIKKGKTDVLVISNQRKDHIQKKLYTLTNTRSWDLSNNFLSSISHRISSLSLTSLYLSSNDFDLFPVQLCSLPSLVTLDLSYNFITSLPSEIHQLSSLISLNLSFNLITEINPELGKLSQLQTLKLSNNYIEKIPDNLSHLRSIKYLSFSHNNIATFPKILWTTIEEFQISANHLHTIPYPFLIQPSLRVLFISHNKLTSFPPSNSGNNPPSNIKEIYINNNELTELTTNIYFFPKLEMLDLKANMLKEIPFELFVHSPLIRSLDISYNINCKWGMHMPNAFSQSSIVRDIHISKNQREEIQKGMLQGMHSDSDTDNETPNNRQYRQKRGPPTTAVPPPLLVNDLPAPPSPQLSSPALPPPPSPPTPSSSPDISPSISPSASPILPISPSIFHATPENTYTASSSSSSSVASLTPRTTTTTITSSITSEAVIDSPSISVSPGGEREVDAAKRRKKKKITFKQVKRYTHNKRRIRVVEHDHAIWEPAVASHAAHLAGLAVWSGAPTANVAEEIKKELLHMTRIRDGLYLSSRYAAQDREALHANNITHILVVGVELVAAFPTEFEYFMITVRDNSIVEDLSLHFPICQKFIDTGRKKGGVLVHCAAGSSRSASCIMAYLMWSEGISFAQARKDLKQLRPIVKTNFYLQLEFYEGLLQRQAKRSKAKLVQTPSLVKPKLVRSTSLPTIDAMHSFKLQSSMENSPPATPTPVPPPLNFAKLHLNVDVNDNSENQGTPKTIFSPRGFIFSPRGTAAEGKVSPKDRKDNRPRFLQRASHSLYDNLRVRMTEPTEKIESPRGTPREVPQQISQPLPPPTAVESENRIVQEAVTEVEEDVGEGVPDSVIRQASDFEDRSEIHQLMRVHSLQDLMEGVNAPMKLTKSTSSKFLKNSKINLLEESYGADTEMEMDGEREGKKEDKEINTTTVSSDQGEKGAESVSNTQVSDEKTEEKESNFRFSPGFSDEVPAGIDDIVDANDLVIGFNSDEQLVSETSSLVVSGEGFEEKVESTTISEIQTITEEEESNKEGADFIDEGTQADNKGKVGEQGLHRSEETIIDRAVNPVMDRLRRKGLSRSEGYKEAPGFDKGFNAGYEAGFNVGFTAGVTASDGNSDTENNNTENGKNTDSVSSENVRVAE